MAIVFPEKKQKQRNLIIILAAIVIVAVLIIWRVRTAPLVTLKTSSPSPEPPKIEINFAVLKNIVLKELQLFEMIKPFEGEAGRANPFIISL